MRESFSYPEVGQSRWGAPPGYAVDHNRLKLGRGENTFRRAVAAVQSWKMFDIGWAELCWPNAPIEVGSTVAVLVHHLGIWSLNACRVVYAVQEDGPMKRYGFAYGTLREHAESGEERFTVEWHASDDSVWYDLFAFSRPRHALARIGYPFSRRLQNRFAQESLRAIVMAVDELCA